jgi:hypothetical protein
MAFVFRTSLAFGLSALCLLPLGCGGSDSSSDPAMFKQNRDLAAIHEVYSQYIKANQRAPAKQSDLTQKMYEGTFPEAVAAIQKGDFTIVWGVNLGKDPKAVVAYEKEAPKQGGMVLLADGTIKKMSADELGGAVKSKG